MDSCLAHFNILLIKIKIILKKMGSGVAGVGVGFTRQYPQTTAFAGEYERLCNTFTVEKNPLLRRKQKRNNCGM